jgi:hypothetical protein
VISPKEALDAFRKTLPIASDPGIYYSNRAQLASFISALMFGAPSLTPDELRWLDRELESARNVGD